MKRSEIRALRSFGPDGKLFVSLDKPGDRSGQYFANRQARGMGQTDRRRWKVRRPAEAPVSRGGYSYGRTIGYMPSLTQGTSDYKLAEGFKKLCGCCLAQHTVLRLTNKGRRRLAELRSKRTLKLKSVRP